MPTAKLPIDDLSERHLGLTQAIAACCLEAIRVCLDRHHTPPIIFAVSDGDEQEKTEIEWHSADDRCKRAWANEIDATEMGACGCSLAAVELRRGLVAVHRAETRTGADYYVAPRGEPFEDLENCWRLEVSGTDKGSLAAVKLRLKEKVQQAQDGNSNLPALASVVGFESKIIVMQTVEVTT